MLHNQVWTAAGMGLRGYLCIGCVEGRLGRTLTRDDFTDVPLNDLNLRCRRSERLIGRLSTTARLKATAAVQPPLFT